MMQTLPWYGYQFFAFVGIFVLVVGGIIVTAIIDAIRLKYVKHPSRFSRVERLESFQREKLPEIARTLGMEVMETVPARVQDAVGANLGFGRASDLLARPYAKGTLSLCNLRTRRTTRMNRPDSYVETTKVEEYTCLVFTGGKEAEFPSFNLTPNQHSLMIKLLNQHVWGAVQYEEDPEFHQKIVIGTLEPEDVRSLLTPDVRAVLKENADLRTSVFGRSIIVYDYGNTGKSFHFFTSRKDGGAYVDCEVISAEDWPRFYEAAESIIQCLIAARQRVS